MEWRLWHRLGPSLGEICRRAFRPTWDLQRCDLQCRFTSIPPSLPDGLACFRLASRDVLAHLVCRLVLAEADVNRVAQKVVGGPGQVRDLGD